MDIEIQVGLEFHNNIYWSIENKMYDEVRIRLECVQQIHITCYVKRVEILINNVYDETRFNQHCAERWEELIDCRPSL